MVVLEDIRRMNVRGYSKLATGMNIEEDLCWKLGLMLGRQIQYIVQRERIRVIFLIIVLT